ncbi:hypothetical protein [Microlunatus antarcticus]|uniref:Uncharacterized protein n=1 Tax=Microlunatus antarcticus TaxID=53388 RepID=A0A7W5P6W2_9ACTN|nr:hypothetical protein [Microlunatus antarcticus]MBB3326944.1 hypothetical protein [Microlunatus antarcticus]
MTSSDDRTAALRRLAEQLHRSLDQAIDDWDAATPAATEATGSRPQTFARPLAAPPVRMEQLARTPEPTADLDDLVDLLVPRLVEQLVPALRDALRDDR